MSLSIADMDTIQQVAVPQTRKIRDSWLLFTVLLSSVISIIATIYYFSKGETLLYGDAYAHLLIARRVTDNITPGLDQLGGTWLPLQHILMFPFIWNDYLWSTGLAGTIPSMISYVIAAVYLFCLLRRITKKTIPGLIGIGIILSNPNILYLQTTPLTEVICTAAFAATAYYLLCWLQERKSNYLGYAAIATCIATLIRYDGWALFLVVSTITIITGISIEQNRNLMIDQVMVYLAVAPFGILYWFIWNIKIFGDPLYFQHGLYSSQAHQLGFLEKGELLAYHNVMSSFQIYLIDVGQTIGWGIFVFALFGLILISVSYRKWQEYCILAVMLTPFVFYVASLYLGQSVIYLPGAGSHTFFNVRYGAQMVLPAAFLIARLISPLYQLPRQSYIKVLLVLLCFICIGTQLISINETGIVSVQDGLIGLSCINNANQITLYLTQHYNGGEILVYEETSGLNNPQNFYAHFDRIIWEGSGVYWKNALAHPEKHVDWVVFNPNNPNDTVTKYVNKHLEVFLSAFKLVSVNSNGLQLYSRINASQSSKHPIPDDLINRPHTCKNE